MKMETNNTTDIPEETSAPPPAQNDLTSPVTILPLVISVATLLGIVVAGCVVYRKRQQKRSQEYARKIRVTQKKIDAIGGTLKAKKDKELAARKAEYYPPTAAACSSVSSLSTPYRLDAQRKRLGETEECNEMSVEFEVCVHENPTSADMTPQHYYETIDTQVEKKEDQEMSTHYSSSCKESEIVSVVNTNNNIVNSSMAVECDTIPTVSSLSTIHSQNYSRVSMARSQSERHSKRSRYSIIRNIRYNIRDKAYPAGPSPVSEQSVSHTGTWGSTTISAHSSIHPQYSDLQLESSEFLDQDSGPLHHSHGGRPNSPASSVTLAGTTDTEGGASEKWV